MQFFERRELTFLVGSLFCYIFALAKAKACVTAGSALVKRSALLYALPKN